MPPGFVRSAAARSSSSWSSGSGRARQRRSGRRASTPRPEHGASTIARSKPLSSSSRASTLTTRTFGPTFFASAARAAGMDLDRRHLAAQHRRLAAGRRARVEDPLAVLRADDERRELRGAAHRPHARRDRRARRRTRPAHRSAPRPARRRAPRAQAARSARASARARPRRRSRAPTSRRSSRDTTP